MEPRIEMLKPGKLVGISMEMSLINDKTGELWQKFMPGRSEVKNRNTTDYISMQIYTENVFANPGALFVKWATVEVSSFAEVPEGMRTYELRGGKYAVFIHKGPASAAAGTMKYIFEEWLPNSDYELDSREHFEILPENYNPMDPDATEEIWIPVKGE